jgi:copper chaperone CopZ
MDHPRRFRLEGMHCGSCVARITDAVQNHHGVQTVRVDLAANRMYDWIARLIPSWGLAYPFVELALGLAYAADWNPTLTHSLTLVIMLIGAGGVIQSRLQKKSIQCACLGSVFNLPMSTVTVVEDLSMAAMAGWMLLS